MLSSVAPAHFAAFVLDQNLAVIGHHDGAKGLLALRPRQFGQRDCAPQMADIAVFRLVHHPILLLPANVRQAAACTTRAAF
jgi:hypothetical protein